MIATKLFISYRRDVSRYQARMIHAAFCQVIPRDHVFMDVDSIPPGANFRKILKDWVNQCEVLLALIGPGWIDASDPKTEGRRLDNPSDFVRIEIGEALARDIPVVPVLIDGAPLPDIGLLPDDLKELVDRQAEFVEYRTFDADMERLIKKLRLDRGVDRTDSLQQTMPARPLKAEAKQRADEEERRRKAEAEKRRRAERRRQEAEVKHRPRTREPEKAVATILSDCYRRALFTRMHAQLGMEAMFASIKKCRETILTEIPNIRNKRLQDEALELLSAVQQIARLEANPDPDLINKFKIVALHYFRKLAKATGGNYPLPKVGKLAEAVYFTQAEADAPLNINDLKNQLAIDAPTVSRRSIQRAR